MTVGKKTYTDKKDAGAALALEIIAKAKTGEFVKVGKFAGFEIRVIKQGSEYVGHITGAQSYKFNVYLEKTTYMATHIATVVEGIDGRIEAWNEALKETQADLAAQQKMIAEPFAKQAELDRKTARFNEIMDILNPKEEQIIGDEEDAVQYQAREKGYWTPRLNSKEWSLLNDRIDIEIRQSDRFLDQNTKWLYAVNGDTKVFAFYGIGDGSEATVLYASGGKKASSEMQKLKNYLEKIKHENDGSRRTFAGWIEAISNAKRKYDTDYVPYGNRRTTLGIDRILSEYSERLGERDNEYGKTNSETAVDAQYQERSGYDIIEPVAERAIMSEARIDDLIADSGAGNRKDYARKWISSINPTDFLNMTLGKTNQDRAKFDIIPGDYGSTVADYDFIDGGLKSSRQTPFLAVDVNTGEVVGHEGRHRMRALEKKGVTYAEIAIEFRDSDGAVVKEKNGNGNPLDTIASMTIFNQRGTGQSAVINNIIPLNKANRENIIKHYGVAADTDVQYQGRSSPLTDREVLEMAAEGIEVDSLSEAEKNALDIFNKRLSDLAQLQEERAELGRQYKPFVNPLAELHLFVFSNAVDGIAAMQVKAEIYKKAGK